MFLSVTLALTLAQLPTPTPFEFKDGDRVVWLGSTLVEREQRYGYWETALLLANPGKKITFRNLGWSGDTVHGEARGRFDFANAEKCFRQIVDQTLELKPTVIFISYGTNESFAGEAGLPKFEKGLEKLLDALKPTSARIVLFSPMKFIPPAKTDPANTNLQRYAGTIRKVAEHRRHHYAELFDWDVGLLAKATDNGLHLNEAGYQLTAPVLLQALGLKMPTIPPEQWEPLRQAIIAKNELFFHRWRPQNETYLFGFRKHEQGKNAKEVAEFDPHIAKAEEEIEKLRRALAK
jgi:lysophospholipase L1-like esterase